MTETQHILDYEEKYPLDMKYDRKSGELHVSINRKSAPWPRLVENLLNQIQIFTLPSEGNGTPRHVRRSEDKATQTLIFRDLPQDFSLQINKDVIGTYHRDAAGNLTRSSHRKATASEMRSMGTLHNMGLNPREAEHAELLEHAKQAVFTDVHTHSSGHISPQGLLKVALDHDAYYPVSLLGEDEDGAGIDTSYERFPSSIRKDIPRVPFPPRDKPNMPDEVQAIPLRALDEGELHQLRLKMEMPGDRQATFSNMENEAYRFRYPFTKNPALIPDTLKQTARELKAKGIKYSEIAYVGLEKPEIFEAVHKTMHEIENDPEFAGLTMRFQAGIPRGFTMSQIATMFEKLKVITDSPYIVGVNLLGYEVTKTNKIVDLVEDFSAWAEQHKPGLTFSFHAGENAKNLTNVEEVIDLAEKFPKINFGIGHGIYGLTDGVVARIQKLLATPQGNTRLRIESNPDSNMALNNINRLEDIPIKRMVEKNLLFTLNSDSAGTYGTSAEQLGLSGYDAGMRQDGFEQLKHNQQRIMQAQVGYSTHIAGEAEAKYKLPWKNIASKTALIEDVTKRLDAVKTVEMKEETPPLLTDEQRAQHFAEARKALGQHEVQLLSNEINDTPGLKGLTPVGIFGAGGESWEKVNPMAQEEVTIAIDMLAHVLDPNKAYFYQGRPKKSGLSDVSGKAIMHANTELKAAGKKPFYVVGEWVEKAFKTKEAGAFAQLTHLHWSQKAQLEVAEVLTSHVVENNGVIISAGGNAFTSDIILEADVRGVLKDDPDNKRIMCLFENAEGASQEKSYWLNPDYRVQTGIDIIEKLHKAHPALFRADFDISKLEDLYEQSKDRVEEYGFESSVDPSNQTIESMKIISQQKGIQK